MMRYKLTEATISRVKNIIQNKECLTPEGKKKMRQLLGYFKKLTKEDYTGNPGGETDLGAGAADGNLMVAEEDHTENNVIAKTFDTKGDFDSYVNQNRGIQMTPKEQQAIIGYTNSKPNQQDNFFVKYEGTDDFGSNDTTVIKKMKDGNQFCWTAFAKTDKAAQEKPEQKSEAPQQPAAQQKPQGQPKPQVPPQAQPVTEQDGMTAEDTIRISKSATFTSDVHGASILANFLIALDI